MSRVSNDLIEEFHSIRGNYDLYPVDNPQRMELYDQLAHISVYSGFAYCIRRGESGETERVPLEPADIEALITKAKQFPEV
jgi:hypothetical protein